MLTPLVERSALESPLLEAAVAASPLHTAERVRERVCVQRGRCVCQQWSDGYCKLRGYTLVYTQQGTLHISQAVPPASTKHAQLPPTTILLYPTRIEHAYLYELQIITLPCLQHGCNGIGIVFDQPCQTCNHPLAQLGKRSLARVAVASSRP